MNESLRSKILAVIREDQIKENEPMYLHTTFRVGGAADTLLVPGNEEEAVALLRLLSDCGEPYFVLGNGSNLLVSDRGYRGTVVMIDHNMARITCHGDTITADAGALLVKIANLAGNNSLTGMEFASGIPGTLGGAVAMNAGAYGGEMKDIVRAVRVFDPDRKECLELDGEDMCFSYRNSRIRSCGYVALSATLQLKTGEKAAILSRMEELKEARTQKQPLEYPSAGSTFKRPEGYFAGKLIEDAGLKGYRVGGAQVSEKHAGFVINTGNATAEDIITLIRDVREKVMEQSGVLLEPEVCMLGEGLEL